MNEKEDCRISKGAFAALLLVGAAIGWRGWMHGRAEDLLFSREYHGAAPVRSAAFPEITTPFAWRGVVATDNTLETLEVSFAPASVFDPDRSVREYKPDPPRHSMRPNAPQRRNCFRPTRNSPPPVSSRPTMATAWSFAICATPRRRPRPPAPNRRDRPRSPAPRRPRRAPFRETAPEPPNFAFARSPLFPYSAKGGRATFASSGWWLSFCFTFPCLLRATLSPMLGRVGVV